jgi:hypothetical protein
LERRSRTDYLVVDHDPGDSGGDVLPSREEQFVADGAAVVDVIGNLFSGVGHFDSAVEVLEIV